MIRSALAVVAGYVGMSLLVIALFGTLGAFWPESFADRTMTPPRSMMATTLFFSLVAAVAGGFVTVSIARRAELVHVLALMALMVVIWVVSIPSARGQATWYRLALLVIGPLGAWLGGRLGIARKFAPDIE
jgi:hypothetical protein